MEVVQLTCNYREKDDERHDYVCIWQRKGTKCLKRTQASFDNYCLVRTDAARRETYVVRK